MANLCNIFNSIRFVYMASKCFAVLPFTISSEGGLKINSCHYSIWFTVLSACVTIFSIVAYPSFIFHMEGSCFLCLLLSNNSSITPSFSNLSNSKYKVIAVKIVNRYFISAMTGVSLVFALYHSTALPIFLHKINNTDKYFRALLKQSATKIECCISVWIIGGIMLVSGPTMIYYLFAELKRLGMSFITVFTLLVVVWESLNSTVCEAQFINLAYLLQVRFRIINNYLAGLQKSGKRPGNFGQSFKRGTRKNYRRINHRVAPLVPESFFKSMPFSSKLLSIEMCRRCHRYLCEMITDVNRMYQLIFISTFSGCFLKVLYCMFSIIVVLTDQLTSSMFEETLKRAFFLIFYASRFSAIILSAYKTVQEAVHTRTVVAELSSSIEDKEIETELLLFYNQVKNSRIEFSACSLFTLNPEMILSAVGVGTTYLVILVQFQAPSD